MSSYRVITLSGSDPALSPYRSMLYSDFLKSLRYGNDWFKEIDSKTFFTVYRGFIDAILNRVDTVVKLAVLSDDLDNCLGWSLYEGPKLHYVFVKKDYRKKGIANALLWKEFSQITHLTKTGKAIWHTKHPSVRFDPFT